MTPEQKDARKPLLTQRIKLQHQLDEIYAALRCKHCMDRAWYERQVTTLSAKIELINDELRAVSGHA
jgi:hypothetical protein